MAKIIDRNTPSETSNPTKDQALTKFIISVQAVFKKSSGGILGTASRRTPITLVIPTKDLECRCPKLKTNKWVTFYVFIFRFFFFFIDHFRDAKHFCVIIIMVLGRLEQWSLLLYWKKCEKIERERKWEWEKSGIKKIAFDIIIYHVMFGKAIFNG